MIRPPTLTPRALVIGVLNTLKVAVVGIVLATILGTLIGIARLSRTGCGAPPGTLCRDDARHAAAAAIAVLVRAVAGPAPAAPGSALGARGVPVQPRPEAAAAGLGARAHLPLLAFVAGLVGTSLWIAGCAARQDATGERARCLAHRARLAGRAAAAGLGCAGRAVHWDVPVLRGFNFQGGATSPRIFALAARAR